MLVFMLCMGIVTVAMLEHIYVMFTFSDKMKSMPSCYNNSGITNDPILASKLETSSERPPLPIRPWVIINDTDDDVRVPEPELYFPEDKQELKVLYHYVQQHLRNIRIHSVELRQEDVTEDGNYKVYEKAAIGDYFPELSLKFRTCLATLSTVDRLHKLIEISDHWDGTISVGVFLYGQEQYDVFRNYISLLEKCYTIVYRKSIFNLVFPIDMGPVNGTKFPNKFERLSCSKSDDAIEEYLTSQESVVGNLSKNIPVPQNHLRNLALSTCYSDFKYAVDIDIIPSTGMAGQLNSFLNVVHNCEKCAYVVPTYEIKHGEAMPKNKKELLKMKKGGKARPFHQKVFPKAQEATNFTKWEATKDMFSSKVRVNHDVNDFEILYEPFYVANGVEVPKYDERFVGFGYTRNSQVSDAYETHLAGYKFKVLSPIFTVHRGMKEMNDWPEARKEQNEANMLKFESFKKEMYYKYRVPAMNQTISISISVDADP